MATSRPIIRFRVNPVEVAIFSVVSLIFLNSVYSLLYDRQGAHPNAMAQVANMQVDRAPAAANPTQQATATIDVKCEATSEPETPAAKARLSGAFCGMAAEGEKFVKAEGTYGTGKTAATLFVDAATGKFSTDYIPLNAGKNTVQVVFTYQGEKGVRTVTQDFNVTRR